MNAPNEGLFDALHVVSSLNHFYRFGTGPGGVVFLAGDNLVGPHLQVIGSALAQSGEHLGEGVPAGNRHRVAVFEGAVAGVADLIPGGLAVDLPGDRNSSLATVLRRKHSGCGKAVLTLLGTGGAEVLPVHRPHRVGVLRAVGHVGIDPAGGFSRSDGLNPGPAGLTGLLPVDPVAGGVGHRPPPHLDAGCGIFQPGEQGPDGAEQPGLLLALAGCSDLQPGPVGHLAVGQGQAAGGCTLGHQVVVSVPSGEELPVLSVPLHHFVLHHPGPRLVFGLVHRQVFARAHHREGVVTVARVSSLKAHIGALAVRGQADVYTIFAGLVLRHGAVFDIAAAVQIEGGVVQLLSLARTVNILVR